MAQIENKQYLGSNFYTLSLFYLIFSVFNYSQEVKQIEIVYAGSFDRNEKVYPEGNILNEDQIKKVHLRHEEMNIFSKRSIFFQKQNSVIAIGEVFINQGDTLKLYCDSLNYNGTNKKMYAHGNVKLINNEMELNSKNLELDRVNNEAFFYDGGRIIDSLSDISSINGKYFIDNKKYVFKNDVVVVPIKGRFRSGGGRGAPELLPGGCDRQCDIEAKHHLPSREAIQPFIPRHVGVEGREIPSLQARQRAGTQPTDQAQDLPMGGGPLLTRRQLRRLGLQQGHVEGPEVHGVEDAIAVPIRANVGCETAVHDPLNGHAVNGCRCDAAVPSHIERCSRFSQQTVMVEQGEVDLDLGLFNGALGGPSVEQVEVEGQCGAVIGHVTFDVAVGIRVEEKLRRQRRVRA